MKKVLKWIIIIIIGLVVLGKIIDATKSPEEKATELAEAQQRKAEQQAASAEADREAIAALPTVTSVQLARDYEANTVAADQKYKDKRYKVTGKVSDINTDFLGKPYITMAGTNSFSKPQFSFSQESEDQLAQLSSGMKLTLVCEGRGDVAKTPMSHNCQILQ